jgi:hypothetical protein
MTSTGGADRPGNLRGPQRLRDDRGYAPMRDAIRRHVELLLDGLAKRQ